MRCTLTHDSTYVDACLDWGDAHYDIAMDPAKQQAVIDRCREVTWERQTAHGTHNPDDFCFDFGCDQWGRVNRWSERVQRGW